MALREKDLHTGLYTTGFMIAMGSRELGFARENGYPLSLISLKVSGLWQKTEDENSDPGNPRLKKLADKISSIAGVGAIVARMGETDFGILLPGAQKESAEEIAFRIKSDPEITSLLGISNPKSGNIKTGIAVSCEDTNGFADMVREAIESMS